MNKIIDQLMFSRMQDALDKRGVKTNIVRKNALSYQLFVNGELLLNSTKCLCEKEVMHLFLEVILNQEKHYDIANIKFVYN